MNQNKTSKQFNLGKLFIQSFDRERQMHNIEIKKHDYIDSLRGFAILGVVLVHTSIWISPTSKILSMIAGQGARGVQLFFLASSLTLFLSISARKEKEDSPILNFFIRRFFRIAPAFYCAIIVYSAYNGLSGTYFTPNGVEWWYSVLTAFFLHAWHPETINSVVPGGWSIAVEMTFYLMVPYLFLKLNSLKSTFILLVIALIGSRLLSILTAYILTPYYHESQYYLISFFTFAWFISQLPVFITGILLYHFIRKYPKTDKTTSNILLILSLFLFGAFLTVETTSNLVPEHIVYGGVFFIFALSLYYHPQKLFVNRMTRWIGKLSFSIYLVHFMVINILKNWFFIDGDLGLFTGFILVLVISTCISYITYKVIEVPGINLGKYILSNLSLNHSTSKHQNPI
jgi:peptidoglycan/LPS O-acetylase OafA/YrhL